LPGSTKIFKYLKSLRQNRAFEKHVKRRQSGTTTIQTPVPGKIRRPIGTTPIQTVVPGAIQRPDVGPPLAPPKLPPSFSVVHSPQVITTPLKITTPPKVTTPPKITTPPKVTTPLKVSPPLPKIAFCSNSKVPPSKVAQPPELSPLPKIALSEVILPVHTSPFDVAPPPKVSLPSSLCDFKEEENLLLFSIKAKLEGMMEQARNIMRYLVGIEEEEIKEDQITITEKVWWSRNRPANSPADSPTYRPTNRHTSGQTDGPSAKKHGRHFSWQRRKRHTSGQTDGPSAKKHGQHFSWQRRKKKNRSVFFCLLILILFRIL